MEGDHAVLRRWCGEGRVGLPSELVRCLLVELLEAAGELLGEVSSRCSRVEGEDEERDEVGPVRVGGSRRLKCSGAKWRQSQPRVEHEREHGNIAMQRATVTHSV